MVDFDLLEAQMEPVGGWDVLVEALALSGNGGYFHAVEDGGLADLCHAEEAELDPLLTEVFEGAVFLGLDGVAGPSEHFFPFEIYKPNVWRPCKSRSSKQQRGKSPPSTSSPKPPSC